jgi:predicted nucleic acid-binding protein
VAPFIEARRALVHALNLCEFYYDCSRTIGRDNALRLLVNVRTMVKVDEDLGEDFLIRVGDLKARGGIALADCFAAALAIRVGGAVVTADHREFEPVAANGLCRVYFFR